MAHHAHATGMPAVILDGVVDTLIREMKPLALETEEYSILGDFKGDSELYYDTFFAMSLVHPAWTSFARRGLWRRVIVDGEAPNTIPRAELRFHLRELAFVPGGMVECQWRYLVDILRDAPNLRELYIDFGDCFGTPHLELLPVLQQFRSQTSLKRLWISGETAPFLKDILVEVSCLKGLKSLVLHCYSVFTDLNTGQFSSLSELGSPPATLKSLALLDTELLTLPITDWLLRPRNGFILENLVIFLDDHADQEIIDEDNHPFAEGFEGFGRCFDECLPKLSSFHVSISNADGDAAVGLQEDTLNTYLLPKATSLRRFTLTVGSRLDSPLLCLPATLTDFHVHHEITFQHVQERYGYIGDKNIATIIAGSRSSLKSPQSPSHLKRLIISYVGQGNPNSDLLAALWLAFSETRMICQELDVALSFEHRTSSFFGDVAENSAFVD
ncbi:hypothetical protein DFH11DRAFT_1576177 [Phellopilus nigrolimitatus]|nr:hypothetical protein DFH11DRAFT_1576177 [Phellopilus nigrolimitatus]